MPLYQIEHTYALSGSRRERLAQAITDIHAEKFHTRKMAVNVTFNRVSTLSTFVGGKRVC